MRLPIFQVDAFTNRVFRGNPAAVCPLPAWIADATMQAIAAENNLAETAFFVRAGDAYEIRWFAPTMEVDLCGHATLASAHVIFTASADPPTEIHFSSKSGPLRVTRTAHGIALDFPSRPPGSCPESPALTAALGKRPRELLLSRDYLAVFDSEDDIRSLVPDMARLAALDAFAVIATAPGRTHDFVSRFFAPKAGIAEDPVTGSAHCTLIPYWAARLGKHTLRAAQLSARGGELLCELRGDRVTIAGQAVTYLEGQIDVPVEPRVTAP
jgi:PhzF family phenazine biosynthesis protein